MLAMNPWPSSIRAWRWKLAALLLRPGHRVTEPCLLSLHRPDLAVDFGPPTGGPRTSLSSRKELG